MAKSVELLKDILNTESELALKYKEALESMAHPDSKATVEKILNAKQEIKTSLQEIIDKSLKCPAIHMTKENFEKAKSCKHS